jgi:GR25 family glycosyltransferase involved in LPS biosynthesis
MKLTELNFDAIYCVNLVSRPERKASAEKHFATLSIPVHYFPAVNGKEIDYRLVSDKHTPGMVGCFLSHHLIYEDAVNKGYQRILVFEDDLKPIPGANIFLSKALPHLPKDWEFCFLGFTHYGGFHRYKEKVNDYFVIPGWGWGTQAYMVNGQQVIHRLHNQTKKMNLQIDEQLIQQILPNKLKHYMIFPSAFGQEAMGTDCQIQKK